MKRPIDWHAECPKCGGGIPQLCADYYCWSSVNQRCKVWHNYGGEHLHRTCINCTYMFVVLTKDFSRTQEEVDDEWLDKKVEEVVASYEPSEPEKEDLYMLLPEDIDWEENESPDEPDLP